MSGPFFLNLFLKDSTVRAASGCYNIPHKGLNGPAAAAFPGLRRSGGITTEKNRVKGIVSIIISAFGFAVMAFFVKRAGDLPVMQKVFFRNLIAGGFSIFVAVRSGVRFEVGKRNRLDMVLRCMFGTMGILCNFESLRYLQMGDANILQKMAPFFSILLSWFVLGEKPDRSAILCVLIALTGAAFIVKPTGGLVSFPALLGLAGGFFAGAAYTFVRKLGVNGVKGPVIVFCFSATTVLVTLPFVILNYVPMSADQVISLLLAGVFAAVGQIFVTRAYTYAPAKEISVFDYTQVLFAALLGMTFLGEVPGPSSLIGYVIIIGTAIWKWKADQKHDAKAA